MDINGILLTLCVVFHISMGAETPTRDLNDGNKIPMVALGTGRGTAKETETVDDVRKAVFWAIESGYRHIDTAAVYKDEKEVGLGIADAIAKGIVRRDQLFVTTKLWNDKHAQDQVVPALKESLSQLGLDYVDLYLIHFPVSTKSDNSPDNIDYLETWKGMEQARELNLTKSIGVSNFNITQLDRLFANSKVKPAVNQVEVNPTLTQEPLVSHCQKLGIVVMAYSPFGFMVSRKVEEAPPPRIDDLILVEMAKKYGKSTNQIVLRYLIERGLVPVPKSTNKERIAKNGDLFDFKLSADEIKTISGFNKNIRVINFISLKSYPNFPFDNE